MALVPGGLAATIQTVDSHKPCCAPKMNSETFSRRVIKKARSGREQGLPESHRIDRTGPRRR
jgi:hypothetical protein